MSRALLPLLLIAGCGSDGVPAGPGDLAANVTADASAPPLDATAPSMLDAGAGEGMPFPGVPCGQFRCLEPLGCATDDHGVTGACSVCVNQICLLCDGPEDCPPTALCCESDSGRYAESACATPANCIVNSITWVMCHVDADCPDSRSARCCLFAAGSPYRRCLATCP